MSHRIVIVGGGFGGVQAALDAAKRCPVGTSVRLIARYPFFNYHAAVYRVIASGSVAGVCVPLEVIFRGTSVEVVLDTATAVDPVAKTVTGASGTAYPYDALILALGSEPAYFGIPGMQEASFPMISAEHALAFRKHLTQTIAAMPSQTPQEKAISGHIVVIGGGPTGVEVASEAITLGRDLARAHGVPPEAIAVSLVEALPRLLPVLPESVGERVRRRLLALGVRLLLTTAVASVDGTTVHLKEGQLQARTLVWTAGLKANALYATIPGVTTDRRGRIEVETSLLAKGVANLYVVGDGAVTPFSGMAQTAVHDATTAVTAIAASLQGQAAVVYPAKKPAYAVPVGRGWAAVAVGPFIVYGWIGYLLRHAADVRYFLSILSPLNIIRLYAGKFDIAPGEAAS